MCKDDKNKKEELHKSDETEVTVNIGYTDECPVQTATKVTQFYTWAPESHDLDYSVQRKINDKKETRTFEIPVKYDYDSDHQYLKLFSIESIRNRATNGESTECIAQDMVSFILKNKDTNPDVVQRAFAMLLGSSKKYYDNGTDNFLGISGFTRINQGNTVEEILTNLCNVPSGEERKGFVCSTIAEFAYILGKRCGIECAMLGGGTESSNHTTFIWKRSDGKYVQTNYGKSYLIEGATNIKDAALAVQSTKSGLITDGWTYLIDENGSYQEFNMAKVVAVGGNEIDKRSYNDEILFDNTPAKKSSICCNINVSNQEAISADVSYTVAYHNPDNTVVKSTENKFGIKQTGKNPISDRAQSFGFETKHNVERKTDTGKKFLETKFLANYTNLHINRFVPELNIDNVELSAEFDQEALKELEDYYREEYESTNNLEDLNNWLSYYENYFENLQEPTFEIYINDIPYSEFDMSTLPPSQIKQIESFIEYQKELKGDYEKQKEHIENEIAYYKDQIENYETYKNQYVEEQIGNLTAQAYEDNQTFKYENTKTENLTLFARKAFGREKTLLKKDNVELTNGYQFSGLIGLNIVTSTDYTVGGDVRVAAEDGLKLDLGREKTHLTTSLTGGITGDFAVKGGTLTPTISPGVKLNASSVFCTKPNNNTTFGCGVSGYNVITRQSNDKGFNINANMSYKPDNSKLTLFGNLNYGVERQNLHIGTFDELTENNRTFGGTVGVQFGKQGSASVNYQREVHKLNPTKNLNNFWLNLTLNIN